MINDEFLMYDPYLTFSDPSNDSFVDSAGKPTPPLVARGADEWTLWAIGREAYDLLEIADKSDFTTRFGNHRADIKTWRDLLIKRAKDGKMLDQDGAQIDPSYFRSQPTLELLHGIWSIFDKYSKFRFQYKYKVENFLFACLEELDNSLLGLKAHNDAVAAAVAASNALANAQAITSGSEVYEKVRSDMARKAAIERHNRDPKQVEKRLVFDCYKEWRAKPERYKSKAEFARDMLEKYPHLKSHKTIEDWVRGWDKKAQLKD